MRELIELQRVPQHGQCGEHATDRRREIRMETEFLASETFIPFLDVQRQIPKI
jgi:hypothetical protein